MFPSLQLLITDLIIIFHAAQWVHILINGGVCRVWLAPEHRSAPPRATRRKAGMCTCGGTVAGWSVTLRWRGLKSFAIVCLSAASWAGVELKGEMTSGDGQCAGHTHTHTHSKYTHFPHTHLHVGPAVFHSVHSPSMPYALTTPGLMDS